MREWDELVEAIRDGNIQRVQLLLDTTPSLIGEQFLGMTALHFAAQSGHEKVAELLITKDPKLLESVTGQGSIPLHFAAQRGHEKMAELLIAKSPKSIDAVSTNGNTALHWTVEQGHRKVAEMLITRNPKLLDAIDNAGRTALHLAAQQGHEQVALMLIKKNPNLLDTVSDNDETALYIAAQNGHEKVAELLRAAKIYFDARGKISKVEGNKKLFYSQEKIQKLLSLQLQDEQNVNVELLDLFNPAAPISQQQLQNFIDAAIKGNKTISVALHLHGEAWASLIIKHIGDNNLQLIYNDPTGNALSKELVVQKLVNAITEQNQDGDTTTTDLRKGQQNVESDSGAIVVDNLVKIVKASNLRKIDLQRLLLGNEQVSELKAKHLLVDDTDPNYSSYRIEKLLKLALTHEPVIVSPIIIFGNKALLLENIRNVIKQITDSGTPVIIPLFTQNKSWSGLVIKIQEDDSLQIIYSNPTGDLLKTEKNSMKLIKAIMELKSEVHIIDIRYKQNGDKLASEAITINNLIKFALSNTNNFHAKDFQKLLSVSENIDQLRLKHDHLIREYIAGRPISDYYASESRKNEDFEHKGDYSEGKEEKMKPQEVYSPPPYEEDASVQMHVLGEDAEA